MLVGWSPMLAWLRRCTPAVAVRTTAELRSKDRRYCAGFWSKLLSLVAARKAISANATAALPSGRGRRRPALLLPVTCSQWSFTFLLTACRIVQPRPPHLWTPEGNPDLHWSQRPCK